MSHKLAEILSCLPSLAAGVRGAGTVRVQLRAAPISSRAKLCQMSPTYSSLDHTSPMKAFMFKACTFPPHIFQIKFSEVVMMFCSRPCRFFLHGNSEGNHSPHFHFALLLFIKRYCEWFRLSMYEAFARGGLLCLWLITISFTALACVALVSIFYYQTSAVTHTWVSQNALLISCIMLWKLTDFSPYLVV